MDSIAGVKTKQADAGRSHNPEIGLEIRRRNRQLDLRGLIAHSAPLDGSWTSQFQGDDLKSGSNQGPITLPRCYLRLQNGLSVPSISISYELLSPFHGGNTGSNPVGDAKPVIFKPNMSSSL